MPLRKTATKVSLLELADLAIGTPEVGAVNFTALHKLLVAILKNLHLQDTVVDIQSLSPEQSHLFEVPRPLPSTVQVGTSKERQKDSMASMPAQTPESGGVVRALSPIRESGVARTPSQMLESDAARKLDQMPSLMLESRAASTPAQLHPLAPERGATRMPAQTRESEMAKALAQTLQSQVKDLGGQVHDLDRQFKTMENQVQGILTHMQHVTALASGLDVDTPEWLAEQEVAAAPMPEKAELMPGAAKLMPEMATSMPDKEPTGLVKIKTDRPQAMQLLQNVMKDVKTLKQAQEKTQGQVQEFPEKLLQRIEEVEKKLRDREELLEQLAQKSMISTAEDVTMVTWEDLEQAITDGWKATVAGPETMIGLPKHRRQTITPSDVTLSGATGKPSTLDQAMDFDQASSFGPEGTPGISGSGQPSEEVFRRGKSRAVSATGFPGREQYPRAHDEAGLAKGHQPPVSQFAVEPDHPRPGEQLSIAHLRRDEQDEHPGAAPQDFTSARDGHRRVSPDPRGGVYVGPDQSYVRPGQDGFRPPGLDQRAFPPLSTYPHGVVPLSKSQLGVIPPGMSEQGLVPPGLGQHGMVPLLAPSRDQQGLELPGTGQPGMVPLSTYEHGMRLPGPDQRGLEQSGMDERGAGPLGMDQPGLVPFGRDQYGFAGPGMDQQGLLPLPTEQSALASPGLMQVATDQRAFVQPISQTPGFMPSGIQQHDVVPPGTSQFYQPDMVPPGAGQPGLVQPGAGQPGLIPPGMDQLGLVPPAAGQPGLVQPGAGQPGLIPPGMDQLGLVPPAAGQPGLVPPGIGQPGLVPPGMDQRGLVQPGMGQPGFMQPGMGQHVLVPPGLDWRGFVQPGAGQPGLVPPGMDQPGLVQPGTGQPSFIQPGAGQPGLVPPGMDQSGLVQPGAGQPGLVPPGMDQSGLVQPSAGQPGLVPPGMDQSGLVQPSAGQPGLVPPGMDQSGLVPSGASQPGLVQPGADQHDLVPHGVDQPGLVQPGAGQPSLVQPGTGQPGLVLPGMDQSGLVQPVAGQPGLVRPGTDQHDLVQPRVDLHGLVQPHIYPHGFFQPTMYPPGLLQPGAYPPGLVQPGAYPHGLVQPRIYQHGLRQLDADQQGLAPSGTESHRFPAIYADSGSLTSPRPYQHALVPPGQDQQGQVSALLARQGLTSPGLAPTRIFQQSLMPPAMYQHGPTPLSRGVPSYQQHLVPPGLYQGGLMDTGPQGPGYPGVAQYVRIGLDQKQPEISRKTTPSKEGTFFRSSGHQFSQEVPSERKDSLEKLTPSFPMAVETFRLMGELISLYVELKENMKSLDKEKAGQTDLEKIQYLLAQMVHKTIPPDLQEQLKTLKTLAKEIRQEKIKLDRMQRILEDEGHLDTGKKMKASQLGLQLGILRVTVADIEKELAELRESQERGKVSMEHSVSEASLYLQDQLDKLRTIIENMLASSSRLLSMSMAPGKSSGTLTPGSINPEATCPACSLDLSHQVSMLVQRYEQLQDMVNNLAVSRPSKKAKLQSQDEELLGHVQNAILQVQGDCEKLNITTSNLIEDHQQKQKDIDVLYQGLEKLKKEKASKAHLDMEIHVKADKSALESKVSRVQFDATTEQLNHMMQELVAKMNGQEQDWQKMLDRLLTEMDSKLDRLELDPLKQLLEDRWKSLRQQLKERSPLYQADEAAAMRRQLLAHFHCLSCDRPLETPVTGQIIPVTPVGPSLPGHRSTRPYTIFELEQVRQHSRSLKLGGTALPRADLAQTEQSVGRLRTMHSKMLMDIEKVQIHFGGSVKASSQMIRELLQTQCLSHPCYKRAPEVADYTYWSVPRRCGGSHTLTYPYRRNRLQHLPQGLYPNEEIQIAMKHDEVDILGFDGHIYKGRMDMRLPGIPTKDNSAMSKHRAKPSRPHVHRQQSLVHNSQPPSRPQSAQMLAGNASASSHEQTDRPVSSQGRLSQPNVAHPSSPIEMAAGLGMHIDVPPGEGLEEPTRGPRSSTPH